MRAREQFDLFLMSKVLDHVRDAIIVTDGDGRFVYINAAAEQQLTRGSALRRREGRLWCAKRGCGTALRQALQAACDPEAPTSTTMLVDDHGHPRLIFGISPITNAVGVLHALIVINEECLPRRRLIEPLKKLFNLTAAEAEIALRIADGATPAEIGRVRGVALNTIRGQMKSMAAKMGCTRQVEIAATVNAIPIAPAPSEHEFGTTVSVSV
jgi:DNA-binding CsgD family transcriptional regulator